MNDSTEDNFFSPPTQLHLIYRLESMRRIIQQTTDLQALLSLAQKAHDISFPVPIDPQFSYKIEGKERTLNMLTQEIRMFAKSNSEIEVIQFQLASTILMLMLQFIEGSLDSMQTVLGGYERKEKIA